MWPWKKVFFEWALCQAVKKCPNFTQQYQKRPRNNQINTQKENYTQNHSYDKEGISAGYDQIP